MTEAGTKNAMLAAAEAGDDKAQCELAMMYEHGIGCAKDYPTAATWYGQAAERGNGFAAYKLGLMHENGLLGEPNPKEAMVWLRRGAELGLSEAQHKLGVMLEIGKGALENPKEAAEWLEKAAQQGIADAQWRLGSLYEQGRGVQQDFEKAAKLYTAASQQGNVNAHYSLGVLHVTGDGVQVNPGEALRLFTMAAEAGHNAAKRRLSAAKTGVAPDAALDSDANGSKKKGDAKSRPPESMQQFWINSLVQSLGLSLVLGVLVLTPVGDMLNAFFKAVGWPLAIVGVVGAGAALLSMAVFFKKRKQQTEDAWFKIACVVLVIIGAAVVIGVIGFSKFQFDNPDDHKNGVSQSSDAAQKLLERAKEAGKQQ